MLSVAAVLPLSGCGDGGATAPPPSPAWTPAPRVTAGPGSFGWASPKNLRGELLPGTWTSTASFTLPAGPATVVGVLKVPGSTAPRFTARLLPSPDPSSSAGHRLSSARDQRRRLRRFLRPLRSGRRARSTVSHDETDTRIPSFRLWARSRQ